MPDVLYGTANCPQLLGYEGNTPLVCGEAADVYTTDTPGEFKSVCVDGHTHVFDSRWADDNVEPN